MVAGSSGFTAGGDLDAFLAELKPNNLGLAPGGVGFKMYGSTQQEEVFSLAQVADQPDIQTAGFLLAGCSNGVGVTLPSSYQLYVIKTDDAGNSACPSTDMQLVPFTPSFTRAVMGMTTTPRAQSCDRYTQFYPPYEPWNRACNADDGIIYWRAGRDPIGGQESDGAASVSDERGMAGATLFSSFPNPVATGNTLTLACTLAKDAEVAVEIADMAGRTVHAETRSGAAGELQIPVSTEGWSAGVYVVKMTVGKDVMMRKIVVSGK